jgi:hypothetical protein
MDGATELLSGLVLAALLLNPTLFLEIAENSVEVVGFDFHRLGDIGRADAGVLLDQFHCLVGTGPATAPAPATGAGFFACFGWSTWTATGAGGSAWTATGAGGSAWTAAGGGAAAELAEGTFKALALLVQLCEAFSD